MLNGIPIPHRAARTSPRVTSSNWTVKCRGRQRYARTRELEDIARVLLLQAGGLSPRFTLHVKEERDPPEISSETITDEVRLEARR